MYRFLKKEERKKISIHILTHTHGCTKLAPHELSCDRDANCTLTHSSLPISHRNARRKASSSSWSRRSRARRVIVWFLNLISSISYMNELLTLLQIGPFVPVPKGYLSRFWNRDSAAVTKVLEAFVPGGRTGTKCPSR